MVSNTSGATGYTTIQETDTDHAANVNVMLGHPALADYVHPDEQFSINGIDEANDQFDLSGGKCYIGLPTETTAAGETRHRTMVSVFLDAETTNIGLANVDATNYVYVQAQVSTQDSPQIVVNDTGNPPSNDSLLVAKLHARDTNDDANAELIEVLDYPNRGPDHLAEVLEHPNGGAIDLSGSEFENATHDEVDVPLVRNLTVDDFEGGKISDTYVGDTGYWTIQSNFVASGSHALEGQMNGSSETRLKSNSGLESYPQEGDTFEFDVYRPGADVDAVFRFAVNGTDYYEIRFHKSGELRLFDADGTQYAANADLNSYTHEWLTATVDWSKDGTITVVATNIDGATVGEITQDVYTSSIELPSGGIEFRVDGAANDLVAYFDKVRVARREREAASETAVGTTAIGNEATPRGGIHTGPTEVSPDSNAYPVVNLPVTDAVAAGDPVGYHLALDEDRALTIEGEADGNGGLQHAFVRANFALGLGDTNRQTLSGDLALTEADAQVQFLDPSGAARNVDLPAEANSLVYIIANTADAAEDLTIRDDSGTTLATVNQDDVACAVSDGTGWAVFAAPGGAT